MKTAINWVLVVSLTATPVVLMGTTGCPPGTTPTGIHEEEPGTDNPNGEDINTGEIEAAPEPPGE